mmetsp:Transcript_50719/g.74362  ORF Transcript_50719/g.74362 Transcript_50719/m.74362 type:complete len:147 (+) Transcript_50719:158-598(+)
MGASGGNASPGLLPLALADLAATLESLFLRAFRDVLGRMVLVLRVKTLEVRGNLTIAPLAVDLTSVAAVSSPLGRCPRRGPPAGAVSLDCDCSANLLLFFFGANAGKNIGSITAVHDFLELALQVRACAHEVFEGAFGDFCYIAGC